MFNEQGIFAAVDIILVQSLDPKTSVFCQRLAESSWSLKCAEIIENSTCIINSDPWSPDQN